MEAVASLNAAIAHLEQAELSLQARKSIALLEQAELGLQARKSTTIPAKHGTTKTDVAGGLLEDLHDAIQKLKQIAAWKQDKLHAVPTSDVKNLISLADTLRYVANNDSLLSSKISTQHVTLAVKSLEEFQGASGNTVIDTAVASKSGKSRPMNPTSSVAYPTTSNNESSTADKEKDNGAPSDASELLLQNRGRLMRTCNECRSKKIKCDGKQLCNHCQIQGCQCTYGRESDRRRDDAPPYFGTLDNQLQRTEALLRNSMPDLNLEDPTLGSAVAESPGKLIPGDISDEDAHKYILNHSKGLEETTRADISHRTFGTDAGNRRKFAGYLSKVSDYIGTPSRKRYDVSELQSHRTVGTDAGNRRRFAGYLSKMSDYIGTPSRKRYDVSEFQQGPAMNYPEIPGEANRSKPLSHVRERWRTAASIPEVLSRSGSPDSYISGKNESGLHGNGTPSRKRYEVSEFQQGPAMNYPEIPGETSRNEYLSHLRERWPAAASIREVSSRNGSPDSHIGDNESFKSPRNLDLQDVEILENRLQRAELPLNDIMPDGALEDPISDPLAALPSTELISGSDNTHHIRFIDSQQGYSHSERGNLDDISESASTDTSCYSRGFMYDMASTAPIELVVDASNESEILALFVSLVHRSDAVVKALDHIVTSKQTDRTAADIAARVRASLKSFVDLLKLETPQEHDTVPSLFLGRSRQISLLIIEAAISRRDAENELSDGDDSGVSDDEIVDQDDDVHLDEEDDEAGGHSDAYVDTASFERVILESNAFTEFLASLYDIAFPDFATRLKRIVRRFEAHSSGMQISQVRELFSELAYAQPTLVIGTTHGPGFSDKVKNSFESVTGAWNWWPLSDPLKPLGPREMRISWTCRCGRTRNENVPEKLAKALISLTKSTPLATSIPLRPSSATNLGRQPSSISPNGNTVQEASSSTNPAPSQDVSIVRLPSPGSLMAAYPNQQTRTIFFMTEKGAMHPKSMGLGQSRIRTQGKCNDRFFKDVRSGYRTYRGWMRTMFSIYQFGFCEFYRFTEYAVNKYARGPQEEIPDLERHKNEYYYRKTVWTPQVSHEEFRDRFWNCLSDCDCNDNGTVDLIPQKIDETGPANDKVFYGIIAREEKQIYMAAIYLAIIGASIIPSLWFFFNWLSPGSIADEALLSNRKGNLSNAIVPLSLCLTLLSCALGVLIAI